jgi:hypothetical protein
LIKVAVRCPWRWLYDVLAGRELEYGDDDDEAQMVLAADRQMEDDQASEAERVAVSQALTSKRRFDPVVFDFVSAALVARGGATVSGGRYFSRHKSGFHGSVGAAVGMDLGVGTGFGFATHPDVLPGRSTQVCVGAGARSLTGCGFWNDAGFGGTFGAGIGLSPGTVTAGQTYTAAPSYGEIWSGVAGFVNWATTTMPPITVMP